MSTDLAYAILRIRQRQARNLGEQRDLEQLFLAFVGGRISADDYERKVQRFFFSSSASPSSGRWVETASDPGPAASPALESS